MSRKRKRRSAADLHRRVLQFARHVQNLAKGNHVVLVEKGETLSDLHWEVVDTEASALYNADSTSQESRRSASDNTGRE